MGLHSDHSIRCPPASPCFHLQRSANLFPIASCRAEASRSCLNDRNQIESRQNLRQRTENRGQSQRSYDGEQKQNTKVEVLKAELPLQTLERISMIAYKKPQKILARNSMRSLLQKLQNLARSPRHELGPQRTNVYFGTKGHETKIIPKAWPGMHDLAKSDKRGKRSEDSVEQPSWVYLATAT